MRASLKKNVVENDVSKKRVLKAKSVASKKTSTTAPKKPVVKKVSEKSSVSKTLRSKKNNLEKSTKHDTAEVVVPSVASLRLLEKVEIYRLWYQETLPAYVANVAKVGGYAFVVFGALIASFSYIYEKNYDQLTAAVVCSSEICEQIDDENLPPGSPLVTFVNSLPDVLTADTDIVLKIENASSSKVFLTSLKSGRTVDLTSIEVTDVNLYRYIVSTRDLEDSSYVMSAEIYSDNKTYKFNGPVFKAPQTKKEIPTQINLDIDENSSTTTATSTISNENVSEIEDNLVSASSTTLSIVSDETIEDTSENDSKQTAVSINIEGQEDNIYLKILTGNLLPFQVEVYGQLESGAEAVFLGLATLVQGEWIFSLSALDLPTARLILFSSFESNGDVYKTPQVSYIPISKTEYTGLKDGSNTAILEQKVKLALATTEIDLNKRANYFSTLSSSTSNFFSHEEEKQLASDKVLVLIDETMQAEGLNIDLLLNRYALAFQGNLDYLVDLAEFALTEHYKSLVPKIVADLETTEFNSTLETLLALRYKKLIEYVKTNETAIKDLTSNLTTTDSDSDGISDHDEMTINQTSTDMADTDNDSVTDGVEIIKNSNPAAADLVNFAKLHGTLETSATSDTLTITSVSPLVVVGQHSDEELIFAVVHGKSIPNSFVTILAYPSLVVGIIKTNSDGEFLYTFEKPLIDGEYEFTAAIADTFGNIVAKSQPYSFTKKLNQFAAAAASSEQVVFNQDDTDNPSLASIITAAVAIVAFGFTLLFLGQTVRLRKNVLLKKTANS